VDAGGRNNALQLLIAETRTSYESLARLMCQVAAEGGDLTLRANKSAVAHWVAGTRPQSQTAVYLVEALSRKLGRRVALADVGLSGDQTPGPDLTGDVVGALSTLGRADVDRRTVTRSIAYSLGALLLPLHYEHIARAARGRERGRIAVGMAEVNAVCDMTAAFNAADERLGGGHARSAVVEYLSTDVAVYLDGSYANDATRRAMFAAAAQLAYLAGWKAHDLGMAGLAQRYYLHSFQLACESDPYAHAGYELRILAHQAMDLGQHEHCVDLAEEALSRAKGRVNAETESLFWLTAGRAHAANHAPGKALSALHRAETLIDQDRTDQGPSWISHGGPAEARLSHQAGKALVALGDLTAAQEQLARSARYWNPTTHPRVYALTHADLAEAQCAQGKVEQACETWNRALDGMNGVRSARTTDAVRTMRSQLASYRKRGLSTARRLDDRAAKIVDAI
jgi:hypothetical protein